MKEQFEGGRVERRQRSELARTVVLDWTSRYPAPATAEMTAEMTMTTAEMSKQEREPS